MFVHLAGVLQNTCMLQVSHLAVLARMQAYAGATYLSQLGVLGVMVACLTLRFGTCVAYKTHTFV